MKNNLRWKQRFHNFKNAFKNYENVMKKESLSELERSGLIHTFEFNFELAWKTLKDYEELQGYTVAGPRDAIKVAFQAGYIENGHAWLEALDNRNLFNHTYDEILAQNAEKMIRSYFTLLDDFHKFFIKKEQVIE